MRSIKMQISKKVNLSYKQWKSSEKEGSEKKFIKTKMFKKVHKKLTRKFINKSSSKKNS